MQEQKKVYWNQNRITAFSPLKKDTTADVVIIGGGITGITTAYLLRDTNLNVILIESDRLASGTTGHTTAKITAQHGLIYHQLIQQQGTERAQQYYQAQNQALATIKAIITKHQIACDFSEEDAYVYTQDSDYLKKIEKEMKAYEQLNIPGEMQAKISLNMSIQAAIKMKKQAQFDPLKYLGFLVDTLSKDTHFDIYEHTPAQDVENGTSNQPTVVTKEGHRIRAKYVVVASHFPFYDNGGLYFARMYAERSHLIAVTPKQACFPGGMYISAEQPIRSVRATIRDGKETWLIGGERYRTGDTKKQTHAFHQLQNFANDMVDLEAVTHQWAAQDLTTSDSIPFIGGLTTRTKNIYVATGFHKWGMSNGMVAAQLITDRILGKENSFVELFSPHRFHVNPDLMKLISMNATTAKHLTKGKLSISTKHIRDLVMNNGTVIQSGKDKIGVYRDENKKLFAVDTTCTHLGCEVKWNKEEDTWDCPCHGSRFSIHGEVLEGPATKPLKQVDLNVTEDA
ncbi:FAD-dependent oxidoreductase [Paraliobacillus ryukyuensis]|uniref:FAD-dependent oxidoreductase n=1 Tax=Paraliobacillus ryukyuensis TaxID=200904 RepID=UPI0009A6EC68|nr:FAD-dependent oxidoreductase [Paraliobacillus ryukyuensis]